MRTWVYLPLVLSALLPYAARFMAGRVSPSAGARAVAAAAAVAAAGFVCSLTLLSLTLFDDLPPLWQFDDRPELGLPKPVPGLVALAAGLMLLVSVGRLIADVRLRWRVLRELRAAGTPTAGLVVADWAEPFAVAVPGRPGHVLVTSGMLRVLSAGEQRVLFAHENAHLRGRHHQWVTATSWAVAVNPLLYPMASLVGHLVERWADEDAAAVVGDRRLVAQAVAKASLAGRRRQVAPAMGMSGSGAVERVMAMQCPRTASRWQPVAGVAALCAALLAATAVAAADFVEVAGAWLAMLT
ncbi:M56 family metallopeptidase [Catellatospora sp. KI3]|uniref:M56 family metallopeptidase n=1 Tax=Catellatospora sp. KI3 TaxID=3041620 RepID=UPI0024832E31|nr:M56 family metallopeptidase [Catellatospora sp. KI3]MDI1461350.1 M56 family metallopeptidase [Catellatospora sp. KI3]